MVRDDAVQLWLFQFHNKASVRIMSEQLQMSNSADLNGTDAWRQYTETMVWPSRTQCPKCFSSAHSGWSSFGSAGGTSTGTSNSMMTGLAQDEVIAYLHSAYGFGPAASSSSKQHPSLWSRLFGSPQEHAHASRQLDASANEPEAEKDKDDVGADSSGFGYMGVVANVLLVMVMLSGTLYSLYLMMMEAVELLWPTAHSCAHVRSPNTMHILHIFGRSKSDEGRDK